MKLNVTVNIIGVSSLFLSQCATQSAKVADSKTKPNLLFIWTDEQQTGVVGAYGNSIIKTPNLDKLAGESFVFKYAYVTQPVSTPSRSSVMTGLYPHTSGCISNNIPLSDTIECLPGCLLIRIMFPHIWVNGISEMRSFRKRDFSIWESIEDNYIDYYSEGKDKNTRSSYHHWLEAKGYKPEDNNRFSRGFRIQTAIK